MSEVAAAMAESNTKKKSGPRTYSGRSSKKIKPDPDGLEGSTFHSLEVFVCLLLLKC